MRNESWLDIRILKTPEVEQPENLERIQDNPKKWKVQENLGFPWLKLSITERLKLFEQACEAIQHAHLKGIVHRDVKLSGGLSLPLSRGYPHWRECSARVLEG